MIYYCKFTAKILAHKPSGEAYPPNASYTDKRTKHRVYYVFRLDTSLDRFKHKAVNSSFYFAIYKLRYIRYYITNLWVTFKNFLNKGLQ